MPRSVAFGDRLGYFPAQHDRHRSARHRRPARHHHPQRSRQAQPARYRRASASCAQAIEKADADPDVRVDGDHRRRREDLLLGLRPGLDPVGQGGPAVVGSAQGQLREGHGPPRGDAHADPVRAERRRLWRRDRHGAGLRFPPRREGHALLHAGGALRPALLSERPAPLYPEGEPELRQARLPAVGGFHRRGPAARRLSRLAGRPRGVQGQGRRDRGQARRAWRRSRCPT